MDSKEKTNTGLSTKEAQKLLLKHGFNEVVIKKQFTALKILLSQFTSFLIIILIITGSVCMFLKEFVDGIAIFSIIIINAIIGFFQEYKAENAVKALKQMIVSEAIVIRDGEEKSIPIRELVQGDVVILAEGNKVPADLEIIESFSLRADEAVLTGESVSIRKSPKKNENKLFKGTIIVCGSGKAMVVKTGANTEFDKIINIVSKEEKAESPLTIQLDSLGKKLGIIIIIFIAFMFAIGKLQGVEWLNMFMTSVSLGVAAIPEGMPIIVTLTLAMGVQTLARNKAIVRKMNAIETLGATTVICSDKTGTLTLNEMTAKKVFVNNKEILISGIGYNWEKKIKAVSFEEKKLMEICENCNNSFVGKTMLGDSTEIALKILARKASHFTTFKKLDEMAFTSERKMMSTLHKVGEKKEIFMKGAPEEVIKRCSFISIKGKTVRLTKKEKEKLEKTVKKYSSEALRVLGFAYKPYKDDFDEKNMIFVGLVGMIDPPRDEVKLALKMAQQAGIKVKIITGDNPLTAKAIGEKLGIKVSNIMTGAEMDKLKDPALAAAIKKTEIFARTSPEHKYRIIDLLKKDNEVVAVTGDGINDAPALKHSDVGIAMGIKGTEATKEVADIILKDDNFATIINTIKEGRRIYKNILSFIKYMLSVNFAELITVGTLTIIGYPLPLLPLQILWINIATDALPALSLGLTAAGKNVMNEKPHEKGENIFKKSLDFIIVAVAIQIICNILVYMYGLHVDEIAGTNLSNLGYPSYTRTFVFTEIVLFELFFAFVCEEHQRHSIKSFFANKWLIGASLISLVLHLGMIYLPFMQTVFKTVPLGIKEWIVLVLFAMTGLLVQPITKLIRKFYGK